MLDSDTCIYLMNGRPEVFAKEPLHECCISSIVLGELEFGCLKSKQKATNRARLELLLGNLQKSPLCARPEGQSEQLA